MFGASLKTLKNCCFLQYFRRWTFLGVWPHGGSWGSREPPGGVVGSHWYILWRLGCSLGVTGVCFGALGASRSRLGAFLKTFKNKWFAYCFRGDMLRGMGVPGGPRALRRLLGDIWASMLAYWDILRNPGVFVGVSRASFGLFGR